MLANLGKIELIVHNNTAKEFIIPELSRYKFLAIGVNLTGSHPTSFQFVFANAINIISNNEFFQLNFIEPTEHFGGDAIVIRYYPHEHKIVKSYEKNNVTFGISVYGIY